MIALRANAAMPKDGTEAMGAPLRLISYAAADLPDATLWDGSIVYDDTNSTIKFSDGSTWITPAGGGGGGISEAPNDGQKYARQSEAWATVTDGDTGPQGPAGPAGPAGQGVPAGGTAGQVLEKIDGTDYNAQWAAPAGSVYSLLKANGNNTAVSIAGVEAAIGWQAVEINTGADASISAGSNIDIATTGTYKFTVTLRVEGNNRVELFIRTYIDTGGGLAFDNSEQVSTYAIRDAAQDTGAVVLSTALQLNSGDTVEFRGFAVALGTCEMLNQGTRLIVERVA